MRKAYIIVTTILVLTSLLILLIWALYFIDSSNEFVDNIVYQSNISSERLKSISDQLLSDHPDRPSKVKIMLEEYPDLDSEPVSALSRILDSNRSYRNGALFCWLMSFLWGVFSLIYIGRVPNSLSGMNRPHR